MVNHNLPPSSNSRKAFLTILLIVLENYQPSNMKIYLKPLTNKLSRMWIIGVRVWNMVVFIDGHGGKHVLYGRNRQTLMSYQKDLAYMFFGHSLKMYEHF
jgi:hypothetical protein